MITKRNIKDYLKHSYLYIIYRIIRSKIEAYSNKQISREKVLDFYSQFLRKGDLCFDAGANIGNKTSIFKELGCKVIAIEPQSYCVKFLKIRFGKGINIVQKALSDSVGTADIMISDANTLSTLSDEWIENVKMKRFMVHTWEKKEVVETTTLDELIKQFGYPKYCKIDVEGYEDKVIKGLNNKINYISFEFAYPESLKNTISCFNHLKKIGDFECNYTEGESMKFKFEKWVTNNNFMNLLEELTVDSNDWGDIYIRFL